MPAVRRHLTLDTVRSHVEATCLRPSDRGLVGVEIELLTYPATDPGRRSPAAALQAIAAPPARLPAGSRITLEPGGQVELSTAPLPGLGLALPAAAADLAALTATLRAAGLEPVGRGLDPLRPPERILDRPRYAAMEAFFDSDGFAGRTMMCSTASVQVNVETGSAGDVAARWHRAHAVGPVLVAMFAHSPVPGGGGCGPRSARQQVWSVMDPARTGPVHGPVLGGEPAPAAGAPVRSAGALAPRAGALVRSAGALVRSAGALAPAAGALAPAAAPARAGGRRSPAEEWLSYALAARVMMIQVTPGRFVPLGGPASSGEPLTFAAWMTRGHELGWPTLDDFDYHLTTLFPPVRPRGWLELRMLDALPDPWWRVAAAVATALLDDADAGAAALEAVSAPPAGTGVADHWRSAARHGLADPALRAAARRIFPAALGALPRLGADMATIAAAESFYERFVARGRCPADDPVPIPEPASATVP